MMHAVSQDNFAGRDQRYLREVQYRDPAKLTARADLHTKYRTAAVAWFPWVAAQIDWPPEGAILEVGCGPGWLWAEAAANFPPNLQLTLTDLSPGMVEVARDRVSALPQFKTVEARVVDAQELPFDDGTFDVVIANHMLYHVPDPLMAVAEVARVLRTDGSLIAATVGPRHLRELWEIRSEVFGGPPMSRNPASFGSVTGEPILRTCFASVEWREYVDTLRCTDPDDVVAFLTSAPPGEDASVDQLRDLQRAIERRFRDGKGVVTISKETGSSSLGTRFKRALDRRLEGAAAWEATSRDVEAIAGQVPRSPV
jgi:SAM-dependent methyltransferase